MTKPFPILINVTGVSSSFEKNKTPQILPQNFTTTYTESCRYDVLHEVSHVCSAGEHCP
jgi:hypothetical protein